MINPRHQKTKLRRRRPLRATYDDEKIPPPRRDYPAVRLKRKLRQTGAKTPKEELDGERSLRPW